MGTQSAEPVVGCGVVSVAVIGRVVGKGDRRAFSRTALDDLPIEVAVLFSFERDDLHAARRVE